jgi:predicted ATPase/DNA-binding SARP family transcriptional activator
MEARLEIYTLGGVQILHAGEPVTGLHTHKAEALLVYLASTRRPQPREVLADLLWDERTQSQAMGNLRGVLTNLRQVLGDTLLITRDTAGINPAVQVWLDALELEESLTAIHRQGKLNSDTASQAANALDLYQGEFLQGFTVFDCRGFEDWSVRERERLHHLVVNGLSTLVDYEIEQSDYQLGMAYASRILELDPLMESAHRQMMQLLAYSGQRVSALSQYETCQKLLKNELGVEPEEETRGLYEKIRAGTVGTNLPTATLSFKKTTLPRHNLPVQLTSFIGREREMGEIKKLLAGTHLLTLTGIGGTGKTRLGLQVADDLVDQFSGGVWLVELAPLRDPCQVEPAVITVLGLHEQPGRPLVEVLVNYLHEKQLLLVLDNCEHLVEACATLTTQLLRTCPKLKILATSRLNINVVGETIFQVLPLALPDPKRVKQPRSLTQYEAIRLFIERANVVQPSFTLTDDNTQAVAQICTQLDGIPLAIELAAVRMRYLSPEQILSRLGDRFNFLTSGSRAALPRQQTLLATLEWSYDLLNEKEKRLFTRLAVFTGGFTLEAAEKVCSDIDGNQNTIMAISKNQICELLGNLVCHSLVISQKRDSEIRYTMLDTIRQFALENLIRMEDINSLKERHLDYYLHAFYNRRFVYNNLPEWYERWVPDYYNLREAMLFALDHNLDFAITLLGPLIHFCDHEIPVQETHAWALHIFHLTRSWPAGKLRAMAIWHAGDRLTDSGHEARGEILLKIALEMAKPIGDKYLLIDILNDLYFSILWQNHPKEAIIIAEQHLALSQELGVKRFQLGSSYWMIGEAFSQNGDNKNGRHYIELALNIQRQENEPFYMALPLESLARIEHLEHNNTRAIELYSECVEIERRVFRARLLGRLYSFGFVFLEEGRAHEARMLFDESIAVADEWHYDLSCRFFSGMAGVATLLGQMERAAQLFGIADVNALQPNGIMLDLYHRVIDPLISKARESLGEVEFNRLWSEGRKLTLDQALELAQQVG